MISIEPNKKISIEQLEKFKTKLKHKLPEDYLKFLLEFNGGIPENNIVKIEFNESLSFMITSFFGISIEEYIDDIQWNIEILDDRIPKGYIPIARAEGGNKVCMNINSDGWGCIYLWLHEEESVIKFALSFNEFIEMITIYNPDEDDLSEYEVLDVWVDPEFLKKFSNE